MHYIELSGREGFQKFIDYRKEGVLKWQVKAKMELGIHSNFLRIPRLMKEHGLRGLASLNYGNEVGTE